MRVDEIKIKPKVATLRIKLETEELRASGIGKLTSAANSKISEGIGVLVITIITNKTASPVLYLSYMKMIARI